MDVLSETTLRDFQRQTGVAFELHAEIDSTNDRALEIAADSEAPLLVLTRRQRAGRGRGGNQWWSADGALTFSLLVDTAPLHLPRARWPLASLSTGLAVAGVLEHVLRGLTVRLKWPNDVHLEGRKVCGILVETTPQAPDRLVIGVGLNVNNSFAAAPPELRSIAISIGDEVGRPVMRVALLARLVESMLARLREAAAGDHVTTRFRNYCRLTGSPVRIRSGGRLIAGVCEGIDSRGALAVRTDSGREFLYSGVVEHYE